LANAIVDAIEGVSMRGIVRRGVASSRGGASVRDNEVGARGVGEIVKSSTKPNTRSIASRP
jgi:hypothetical protein